MTGTIAARALAALLAAASFAAAAAADPPAAVSARYDVRRNGLHVISVEERYEARDGAYRITSDSHAVGAFALIQRRPARAISSGRVTPRGLRPEHFEAARGVGDARRVSADFDWSAARITLNHDGRQDALELPAGTQDRLSVMYQFLFAAPTREVPYEFPMTNGRKLDRYRYAVTPGIEIDTPLGRIATVHLVKQRAAGDTETEIWLSPRHHFLPVKLLIVEDDGVRYEQTVTRLETQP